MRKPSFLVMHYSFFLLGIVFDTYGGMCAFFDGAECPLLMRNVPLCWVSFSIPMVEGAFSGDAKSSLCWVSFSIPMAECVRSLMVRNVLC